MAQEPDINIELTHVDEVRGMLKSIPGGLRVALEQSILVALRKGKSYAKTAAASRYNLPPAWLTKSLGTPRLSGPLSGMLRISGTRIPLGQVPGATDASPLGVFVPELKSHESLHLLRAFARSGRILERTSPSRLPLRSLVGISAAKAIGEKTEVYPAMQFQMEFAMYTELNRMIGLILQGSVVPKEAR
jgi:hypothetical protein